MYTLQLLSIHTCFSHSNAAIDNRERFVHLIRNDPDKKLWLSIQLRLISKALESDLIKRIGGVTDEFSEKDLLVTVKSVDDQAEKLVDLGLECESFDICHLKLKSTVNLIADCVRLYESDLIIL